MQHFPRSVPLQAGIRMRAAISFILAGFLLSHIGCAPIPIASQPVTNPVQVQAADMNLVWEKTVDTLHEFQFPIERENRLSGEIVTEFKVGAGILEPWHFDAADSSERWEGTMQPLRRKMVVHLVPIPEGGGYFVSVEAFKEIEDLAGIAANSPGGATFQENAPLSRNLNLVVGQSSRSNWISKGRDQALEQAFLAALVQNVQGR